MSCRELVKVLKICSVADASIVLREAKQQRSDNNVKAAHKQ